jgi:hypothetical protein
MTSSRESRHGQHGGRNGPSLKSTTQLTIQKKTAKEKSQEIDDSCNEQKENLIEDYVDGATCVGSKQVEDSETAIPQELDDIR